MSEMKNDKELIQRYLKGDVESFQLLVNRYQDKIFSYIMLVVKDRQLADDLFQDTFLKIIRTLKAGAYQEEGKFMQFAMRIAHNLIIDHYRKAQRLPLVAQSNDDYSYVDNARMAEPTAEDLMVKEQIYSDLRAMVDLLPMEQREVLQMRIYAEMSFKEIADATNVSINTALGRMRYAIINLRKMAKEKKIMLSV